MSREALAAAAERLGTAYLEFARVLRGNDAPQAGSSGQPAASPVGAGMGPSVPPPSQRFSEEATAPLGQCPVHHKPWVVKPAGVSKNGNKYPAFWKCNERDDEGYCNEKPKPAWLASHPPVQAIPA